MSASQPHPVVTPYLIGTGIGNVTDPAIGLGMQGMQDVTQKTTDVESQLYARAFVVEERDNQRRVAIVIGDIWGMSQYLNSHILNALPQALRGLYTEQNLLLAGTHQHSGPGGYMGVTMFDYAAGGVDGQTVQIVVAGFVNALTAAHNAIGRGRVYVNLGTMTDDCGRNRSEPAYLENAIAERNHYGADTDKQMLLLKFTRVDPDTGQESPAGMLNWYAVHPVDHGQTNFHVCGGQQGLGGLALRAPDGLLVRRRLRQLELRRRLAER
jgi:neutral ceramidase